MGLSSSTYGINSSSVQLLLISIWLILIIVLGKEIHHLLEVSQIIINFVSWDLIHWYSIKLELSVTLYFDSLFRRIFLWFSYIVTKHMVILDCLWIDSAQSFQFTLNVIQK
jgi:hypothetical protein